MKIQIALLIILFTVASCGKNAGVQKKSDSSVTLTENLVSNCTVERDEALKLVEISCPDGTNEIIYDGTNGIDGANGEDGTSCTIAEFSTGSMITCGETQAFIKNGTNGADGSACKVTTATNGTGALIECTDGSSAFIKHGENGTDGQDGADGQNGSDGQDGADGQNGSDGVDAVQTIIDPCGQETTHGLDEVILVLSSGEVLAHFSNGSDQYLTILKKETWYVTTDGTGCRFKIDSTGEIAY